MKGYFIIATRTILEATEMLYFLNNDSDYNMNNASDIELNNDPDIEFKYFMSQINYLDKKRIEIMEIKDQAKKDFHDDFTNVFYYTTTDLCQEYLNEYDKWRESIKKSKDI